MRGRAHQMQMRRRFPLHGRRVHLLYALLSCAVPGCLLKAFTPGVHESAGLARSSGTSLTKLPPANLFHISSRQSRTEGAQLVQRRAVFSVLAEEVNSRPSFFFGEVFIIVILSTGFEKAEKWLRTRLKIAGDKIGREILDALFREITILGFIGLLLFVLTHLLPEDTPLISLGADEYNILPETFEYVHMATFLLLVVLLFQGFAVLKLSRETAETWAEYESTRAFGKSKRSMETKLVEAGYLKRVDNPFSITGYELQPVKNFGYGDTPLERVGLRTKEVHKLIMWRSIRHGFLFDGPQSELLVNEGGVIPGLFSFESFLEQQLGQIVLALVEVDVTTWFVSLLVVAVVTSICLALDSVNAQLMQCFCCWGLFAIGLIYSVVLEEDTWELTPQVPKDPREVLRLFTGTSIQMVRRSSWLGRTPEEAVSKILSQSGRRFRPMMPGIDGTPWPRIRPTPREEHSLTSSFYMVQDYTVAFKLLCFLQAAVVASLIVELLNGSIHGPDRTIPFALACIEWPLMLFWLVPSLVRRLTLRAALTRTKSNAWFKKNQRGLVRQVMVAGIEGLLRDCTRLIHLQGMESRAFVTGETWAQAEAVTKAMTGQSRAYLDSHLRQIAINNVNRGQALFDELPPNLKSEVSSIFTSWDAANSGFVAPQELANNMELLGFNATSERLAKNLIRMVDNDGSGLLSWRKCRALFMLATRGRPTTERRRDLTTFFSRVKKQSPREMTVFELADALPLHSITAEDLSSLMYRHFGKVKPSLTRPEFVEWIEAVEQSMVIDEEV
ncbi:unnamed protein product [Symbiodinium microadriaticum]|nr:unnamed protein product [Symbiodinium microadriaticum]